MANYGFTGAFASHWLYTDGTCVHISFGVLTKQGTWTGGEYLSANCASSLSSNWYNWSATITSSYDRTGAIFSGQWTGNMAYQPETYIRMANTTASADFWSTGNELYGSSLTSTSLFMSMSSADVSLSLTTESHPMSSLLRYAPSTSTWRTPMVPVLLMRGVTSPADSVYVLGRVPRVTFLRMTDDMPNASLIHTDWRVFPLFSRVTTDTSLVAPGSGNWAIAYREI
jgi:hypothetical protein